MRASYNKYILNFKTPSGTSRGVLTTKETYFLEITDGINKGLGECGLFRGLSYDDVLDYEEKLNWLCENIHLAPDVLKEHLRHYPSIWIGYEQAMLNLSQDKNIYFPSDFTEGKDFIKINGLIWMGSVEFMQKQIEDKLSQGFDCIKLKIGVDWISERQIISELRQIYPKNQLEIRVDANGAFTIEEAKTVLQQLADLEIHSIEQPIKAGQLEEVAKLCQNTPTPIALDEELIGVVQVEEKQKLLEKIKPQYIILKPSLVGGFSGTDEWINLAETLGIDWWITSALESNIGLNAIAQYTYTKQSKMPQGLGTGGLFTNNLETPIILNGDRLGFAKF
ncbi:o-succinylbenzoate synthase [Riemerella anatipestifer]|nr:o-succinylbenzoate synthase [Riemerella anatipestifer]MDY3533976.1 o-succinylbenzoate synthase [Riemerella anatipestifer]MDY3536190.1 o-succinylbenzoate synthase [Riemerella anatipestifer]